jgi:Fe-S cluster assembly ATP-binding protein
MNLNTLKGLNKRNVKHKKNLHASIEVKENIKRNQSRSKSRRNSCDNGTKRCRKSTLASIIAGNETYEVTDGEIILEGEDLRELAPEERSKVFFVSVP